LFSRRFRKAADEKNICGFFLNMRENIFCPEKFPARAAKSVLIFAFRKLFLRVLRIAHGKIAKEISFHHTMISLQSWPMNFTFHGLEVSAHGS